MGHWGQTKQNHPRRELMFIAKNRRFTLILWQRADEAVFGVIRSCEWVIPARSLGG